MEKGYIARILVIMYATSVSTGVAVLLGMQWVPGVSSWVSKFLIVSGLSLIWLVAAYASVFLLYFVIGLIGVVKYGREEFENIFNDIEEKLERFEKHG